MSANEHKLFINCLIDTGSSVTLMRGQKFVEICSKMRRSATLIPGPRLHSVNGESLNVKGHTEFKFDHCPPVTVVVIDGIIPDCIIGIDFLRDAKAELLVHKNKIKLFDKIYSCHKENEEYISLVGDSYPPLIQDVFTRYEHIFSTDSEKLGRCLVELCHIDTGSAAPIKQRPYRLPLHK